jgi:hemolysin III
MLAQPFNAVSHMPGILLGVWGIVLITPWKHKSYLKKISILIFWLSVVFLYTSSTFYHATLSSTWLTLDHCGIFILIAGTYTPICALSLRKTCGWRLLAFAWMMAFGGILLRSVDSLPLWSLAPVFLAMGWIMMYEHAAIQLAFGTQAFRLLLVGGISYSVGAMFFWLQMPEAWYHEALHIFVLIGTMVHARLIANFILP